MNDNTPHNLLPVCRAFSGREADLDRLLGMVTAGRVCQLTGPAGIGKSELVRAVGHRARQGGAFPHGVFHIAMDDAGHPATLIGDLVLLLRFDETKDFNKSLGGRRILVIWDQMDTLLATRPEAVAEALNIKLGGVDTLHHLVVSRSGMADVPAMALGPLDPAVTRAVFTANLPQSVSARPADDDPALAAALDILGGNPLAIQVAAGWCHPPNWTDDLELALQKRTEPDGLARMLGVALHGLGDEPMRLLALLHAFPGGATAETVDSTFGSESAEPLARLRKAGLLAASDQRHTLHPALRRFVAERLGPLRADAFREQAAVFLHQMLRECRNQVDAGHVTPAMQFMLREWPNLRAAFTWAVARMEKAGVDLDEDCELILDYCFVLFHLFTNRFMFSEGLAWMEVGRAAALEVGKPHELALIRDYIGILDIYLHNDQAGQAELEAALAAFRGLGEQSGIASAGYHLGLLAFRGGDLATAQNLFEEVLPLLRGSSNRAFAAQATTFLGQIHLGQGNARLAHDTLSDAMALYQEQTISIELRLNTLFGLARAALALGDEEESLDRVREAVSVAFGVSPRVATAALPNILQMAEAYLTHAGGGRFGAFTESLTGLVEKLRGANPHPEIAREWAMTCHLMGKLSDLLTHMAPLLGADPAGTAERVGAEARELDALSGGLLGVERWVNDWLARRAAAG
ncbi:MAG: ATP-binding protein [Nitrospirae bacterium]|nr:ATP-binding protein [Nitrospirota bacterium]